MVGTQLLHYKITRKLGAGGMGEVFEAEDLKLGRTVALKFVLEHISGNSEVLERFAREAKAISRMDHPNVGAVFALEQSGDKTFLAMAHYQGETLRERLDQSRLGLHDALRFALEIARGLEHAHAQGVTHRDVKPANIFLSRQANGTSVIKLLDFGLARLEDASRMMTTPGATTGTLMYMAPEQMRGQVIGHQVDVWAWGAVTFEMLAGRPPFVQENIGALLAAILSLEPDPLEELCPDAPTALVTLVKWALRKNPAERVESASLIVQGLESIIAGVPASGMGSSIPASSSPASSSPGTRAETASLNPNVLGQSSSGSEHPAFVSGSQWSSSNWSEPAAETRAEPLASSKPIGSKSALWLLAPVALVGIVAGGFGIMSSRLSQLAVQATVIPNVQAESSSKPVIAPSPNGAASLEPKPAPSKPTQGKPTSSKSASIKPTQGESASIKPTQGESASVKPAAPVKPPTVAAEVNAPTAPVDAEPARAAFSTPAKPGNSSQSNPVQSSTPRIQTAPAKTSSSVAPAKPAPVKTESVKAATTNPAPAKPSGEPNTATSLKPATNPAPVVETAPSPPKEPDCKPVAQANAVLERVLIASTNTLPLMDCGAYLHAKGPGNPAWFPEALEVWREVIALQNGTVMIADAVHYADARRPLGLIPMPSDAKSVANADLNGGHQWRSESENITVNAMNLIYMKTQAKDGVLEVTSTDDPSQDFVFLTVYQGGTEEIANLNVGGSKEHDRNFAGLLLNDENAIFLGPGADAKASNFEVTVPPRIKTYLVAGLEPGTNCKIGFEPERNWWTISIKPGDDGTVNSAGVVMLETKAPTY